MEAKPARPLPLLLALLAGCAQVPPAPPPADPPPPVRAVAQDPGRADAIAKHRRLAEAARKSGDLAAAATHLQILTLLEPANDGWSRDLAAVRAAIARDARAEVQAGQTALAAGDLERASRAMLRALALDPADAEAQKALREIDRRRFTRIQADRSARALNLQDQVATAAAQRAQAGRNDAGDGYDVEQAIELFRAGDTAGGLREFKAYVDANPGNRVVRQRIAGVAADRARELENQGQREQALNLYEQATALRGDTAGPWAARMPPLKKALSQEYFEKGSRVFRSDLAQAIAYFEASLRYDPANAQSAAKLREAKVARDKLGRIN